MTKRYIANFDTKENMEKFIEEYKDIIKVIRTKKQIHYPYKSYHLNQDNWVQYQEIWFLYYEADWEPVIEANNKIIENIIKEK